jgi:hypothetical protein
MWFNKSKEVFMNLAIGYPIKGELGMQIWQVYIHLGKLNIDSGITSSSQQSLLNQLFTVYWLIS